MAKGLNVAPTVAEGCDEAVEGRNETEGRNEASMVSEGRHEAEEGRTGPEWKTMWAEEAERVAQRVERNAPRDAEEVAYTELEYKVLLRRLWWRSTPRLRRPKRLQRP